MHHIIVPIMMAVAWWYGIDSSGVVTGWQCSKEAPPPSSLGNAVTVREGAGPGVLASEIGPHESPDRVRLWAWDQGGERPRRRTVIERAADERKIQRAAWRVALREYREAAALDQDDPDAYTDEEIQALRTEADRLKAAIGR